MTASTETPQRLLYDTRSAAQQLSISKRSMYYLINHLKVKTVRLGSRVMIPHKELARVARIGFLGSITPSPRKPSDPTRENDAT